MSKCLSLVAAGAPAALIQAAASIVSKATGGAVKTTQATAAESHAVVVGPEVPCGIFASVTQPPSKPEAAYASVRTTVVRAILPRGAQDTLPLRDILDVYPSAGIDCSAEQGKAADAYRRAAEVAVKKAKESKVNRLTLVTKQATKYQHMNDLFVKSVSQVAEGAGLIVEVIHTAQAANELVMFPEKFGVVMTNDEPIGENIEKAFAGVTGGAHCTYMTVQGGQISGGRSYASVARAVAQELRAMGMAKEAAKIEAAAEKDPQNVTAAL